MTAGTAHQCGDMVLAREIAGVEAEVRRTLLAAASGMPETAGLAVAAQRLRRHLLTVGEASADATRMRHYLWFAQQIGAILRQADTPRELARLLEDTIRLIRAHVGA